MPETDWKEAYFRQQREFANKLGCVAHPNNIDASLSDLQRRAAGEDRKRSRRRARLKTSVTKALRSEGVVADEIKTISDKLEEIAQILTEPHGLSCHSARG